MNNNPYRPGAGFMPTYLAGRESEIEQVQAMFTAMKNGIPVQSMILTGLRGVGKTVLLNKLEENAENQGITYQHMEIEEKSNFIEQTAALCRVIMLEISRKKMLTAQLEKLLTAVKSLEISFSPGEGSFSLSAIERELYTSNSLSFTLKDVFEQLGAIALKADKPICIFIDEIQNLKKEELSSLIVALHRVNQKGYPLNVIGAGLPTTLKLAGDAKSYAERLFEYRNIGSLNRDSAMEAVVQPAKKLNVTYSQEALERILELTKEYPYFIQEMCKEVWDRTQEGTNIIDLNNVNLAEKGFFEKLDEGFFKVRFQRCSQSEKQFMFAMIECDSLPCVIKNVAKILNKEVSSISPTRATLLAKGIIYAVGHGELDFTVPEFDNYLRRISKSEID